MKKLLSLFAATAICLSAVPTTFAQTEPTIKVDGRMIDFRDDQAPVIMNDRLYVPLRRVLEEMGAKVIWNGENKTITVKSDNNVIVLELAIDSTEISKTTYTSVITSEKETLVSDVAPVIMNDRTMLPIRIVAEAIGGIVKWDGETKLTTITSRKAKRVAEYYHGADVTTEEFDVAEVYNDKVPHLSISCDAEDVNEGDIIDIAVKLSDIEKAGENKLFSILTASLFYNKDNFKYSGFKFIEDGEESNPELSTNNPEFLPGVIKLIALNSYMNAFLPGEDDVIAIISFKATNGDGGEFVLSTGSTDLGPNTSVTLYEDVDGKPVLTDLVSHDELYIDTTPVVLK